MISRNKEEGMNDLKFFKYVGAGHGWLTVLDHLKHNLSGNVDSQCNMELRILLKWEAIPMSKMGCYCQISGQSTKK